VQKQCGVYFGMCHLGDCLETQHGCGVVCGNVCTACAVSRMLYWGTCDTGIPGRKQQSCSLVCCCLTLQQHVALAAIDQTLPSSCACIVAVTSGFAWRMCICVA
jgi:hypothetical protein